MKRKKERGGVEGKGQARVEGGGQARGGWEGAGEAAVTLPR